MKKINDFKYRAFSFYNIHVNPDIPFYQKCVFDKFGTPIEQVYDNTMTFDQYLNYICRTKIDTDYLIFFDIDCIPLTQDWLDVLKSDLSSDNTIVGAAQTANHLNGGKNLYISPNFFAISTSYLKKLDYPDMSAVDDMDSGHNLTKQIIEADGNLKFWWPTSIEEEKWNLYHSTHTRFGLGTTFNNTVYHGFESRNSLGDNFINKCRLLLKAQ